MGLTCSVFIKISSRAKQTTIQRNFNFEISFYMTQRQNSIVVQMHDFMF